MNEESIKRMESKLVKAYKEGHYKEDLEKMIAPKPTLVQRIVDMFSNQNHRLSRWFVLAL